MLSPSVRGTGEIRQRGTEGVFSGLERAPAHCARVITDRLSGDAQSSRHFGLLQVIPQQVSHLPLLVRHFRYLVLDQSSDPVQDNVALRTEPPEDPPVPTLLLRDNDPLAGAV